ncbi:hypothetical protein FCH28_21990 [Streptomyces piniterrae]|uniref:Uncharacterized protein n=1 Tax=Streptomyces piniterrae TaxID=2571125 RepID=A0A4U0NBQ9_9ACTN|nr:hypothetical protein [Streptomyces piniterrae]TJZ51163.1 hypothetical protein FCH28_21990 [Streptomyces piniterrae]
MPESADRQEIRIRITGTNNPQQDNADLTAWLEREPWLTRQRHEWVTRTRPVDKADGPDGQDGSGAADGTDLGDMAVGVDDLVLVIVGAITAEITKSLSIAVREWLRRRKQDRAAGEQPAVAVGGDGGAPAPGDASPEHPDPGGPASEGGSTREG